MKLFLHHDQPVSSTDQQEVVKTETENSLFSAESAKTVVRLVATHAAVKLVVDTSFAILKKLTRRKP